MVLDDTPLRLVSEEYGNSAMGTAGTSARSAVKGGRSRRNRQPQEVARQRTVRLPPHLSVVANDGSLHPSGKQATPVEPMQVVRPAGTAVRILLVDAGKRERKACGVALQQHALFEAEVLEAETGQDGLQMAFHQALDCILLSNGLPDMSSMEFVAQLAGGIGDARLPVLSLADGKSFAALGQWMRNGTHECLIKDAEGHYLALLPTIVKRMLDGHRNLRGKRQAEAMYRTLIEHIQAITYIVSPHHGNQITYVSPQIEQLGITPDMWTMNPGLHFQHVHEEDRDAVEKAFSHTCRSGEEFCQDYRLCCANGSVRWFHDTASVVKDHNGHPMFLQGVMVDITNIKEMEAELEEHRHHMERRVAQRTEALERRIAVLESCNASLCDQMEKLRNAHVFQIQMPAGGHRLVNIPGSPECSRPSLMGV